MMHQDRLNRFKVAATVIVMTGGLWLSNAVHAASGWVKGTVEFERTHDATASPVWAPPIFWFTLNGVGSAGVCPLWNGRVLFVARDKQQLALVTAALVGGNVVAVNFDDSILQNGYCVAEYTTLRANNAADVN